MGGRGDSKGFHMINGSRQEVIQTAWLCWVSDGLGRACGRGTSTIASGNENHNLHFGPRLGRAVRW